MDPLPAREYHRRTAHTPESVRAGSSRLDVANKPIPYKLYLDQPTVPLPPDRRSPAVPALRAIGQSRADPSLADAPSETDFGGDDPASPCAPRPDGDDVSGDRRTVAGLTHYAAGITKRFGGEPLDDDPRTLSRDRLLEAAHVRYHAAACTGKLYHIDCYLVTGDLADLSAGVYHFEPVSESLDGLCTGDYRGVLATAADSAAPAEAPVTAVLTSTWWRNAWKYGPRTFRHAFWDSGTILANLLATAHGLGCRASVQAGFADETVAELLGVDPETEAPVAIVPVGEQAPRQDAPAVTPLEVETRPLSPDPRDYPLIHRAWAAGTLDDQTGVRAWRERATGFRPQGPDADGEQTVSLDPAGPADVPERDLPTTIRRRGSCREYRRDTVPFRTVSTILSGAMRGVPLDVRDQDGPPLPLLEPHLIAAGVTDLPDGAYRYDPGRAVLELIRPGTFRREAGHLALDQRLGADAAVSVYFLADLEAITDAVGDRGYRVAQLCGGLTAGRLYLATYAHDDLGGTGLTFYDNAVSEFFGRDPATVQPMFCYTLGRPA